MAMLLSCEKNDLYPDPLFFKADFEKTIMNAAKNTLGEHLTINGCFYHFCQNTNRKLIELRLKRRYTDDQDFNNFYASLDFFPLPRLQEGVDYLKSNIPCGTKELFEYFEQTCVSGTVRRVNNNDNDVLSKTVRRIPPIFLLKTWNVHNNN